MCIDCEYYFAIASKMIPTPRPPAVPRMYPINAIMTPIGTNAFEYALASIGADATPPMFANDETPSEKRSSLKIFANIIIQIKWTNKTVKPAIIKIGACDISLKSALDAIRATKRYNIIDDIMFDPATLLTGVIAAITPKKVESSTTQV